MMASSSVPDRTNSVSEQRTVLGILVHLLGLVFGIFGAGPVYLLSSNESTKTNARNALNWQLFFLIAFFLLFALGFGLQTISEIIALFIILLILVLLFLDFVFCLWAAVKATGGNAWEYPLAPELI